MKSGFKSLMKDRRGQGMTEYIIIVALIAIACLVIFGVFGKQIRQVVDGMGAALSGNTKTVTQEQMNTQGKSMSDFSAEQQGQ